MVADRGLRRGLRSARHIRFAFLLSADSRRGAGVGGHGFVVESVERLQRVRLFRPRRVLRSGCVFRRARADSLGAFALDRHSMRGRGGRSGRCDRGAADLPAARSLFCTRHAGLSAGTALCIRVAGISGTHPADAPRAGVCLHAIRGSPRLRLAGGRAYGCRHAAHQCSRALALWHVVAGDSRRRGGGRSRGYPHAFLETQGHHPERRAGRRGRGFLCRRAAGGDAACGVRHAGLGAGLDRSHVRRRGHAVGARSSARWCSSP